MYALAVVGNTVYVGGYYFTTIGGAIHLGAVAITTTGAVVAKAYDAQYNGIIEAVAVDASNRVVVGGRFIQAGSLSRFNIARFNADGTLDAAWNPNSDDGVTALAVSGDTVYAGGGFTTIGGQARNGLAALDASSGAATAWNPNPDERVWSLAVSGDTVYVRGYFAFIGGQARNGLAALDAGSGAATAWNPDPNGAVYTVVVAGNTVYVSGAFTAIGGQARNGLAALDASSGAATAWNPNPDHGVSALAVSGDTVYVSGSFTTIGGQARNNLAALDAGSGAATAWNPNPDAWVAALAISGDTVYVGGYYFKTVGGEARKGLAALDARIGAATAWNPDPDGAVYALAVAGDTVYAGGAFAQINSVPRVAFAALPAEDTVASPTTLIEHYYQTILGRAPDAGGREFWEGEVGRMLGLRVDVREAFRVMAGWFFYSPEYLDRGASDSQYITDLYQAFFRRAPDSGGRAFWLNQLALGMPRGVVLFSFLFSPEFTSYMQSVLGDSISRAEVAAIVDFYRGFLNRLPDNDGFNYWLDRFRVAQCQGAVAVSAEADAISRQFLASDEYLNRNRTNREYVADLYYAFLRRGGELAGFNTWVSQLDNGARSREQERQAFLQSPEFQSRVSQIIDQGCFIP